MYPPEIINSIFETVNRLNRAAEKSGDSVTYKRVADELKLSESGVQKLLKRNNIKLVKNKKHSVYITKINNGVTV